LKLLSLACFFVAQGAFDFAALEFVTDQAAGVGFDKAQSLRQLDANIAVTMVDRT